ncbi:MAG TPA: PA2169 family four-helix-bundle protein [Dinghuibacter sp.]|uniref:PA2169 family four-helix-bundle protein n=1 Tax=Dinghuibacter sp. TaxID=2024697 RepID=UPI002D087A51|nr:PA2169 family four-helix-bundle protein [Dinghuibacter sp.]HTJ13609.1 PA2169 family four-helix-bundle protein [Dinghuibacter sp.]
METLTSLGAVEILHDLVRINNDRIAGYMKALEELRPEDADLKILFMRNIDQSRRFKLSLGTELLSLGGDLEKESGLSGAIYRAWMQVKNTFSHGSRRSILGSCAYGEEAAQNSYEDALHSEQLPGDLSTIIQEQKEMLQSSQEQVNLLLKLCD